MTRELVLARSCLGESEAVITGSSSSETSCSHSPRTGNQQVNGQTRHGGGAMKTTIERELKFEGDDIQIDRLGGEPIEPHVFASSYHDTADRRLLRAGITLRRRVENGVEQVAAEAAERREPPRARGAGRPGVAAVDARPAPLGNPPRLGARVDRDARDAPPRPAGRRRRGHDRRCLGARRHGGRRTLLGDRGGARERFATLDRARRQSPARAGRDPGSETPKILRVVELPSAPQRRSESARARASTRVHLGHSSTSSEQTIRSSEQPTTPTPFTT